MPEVKRREMQRRQQRRERLWRGDTNNGSADGDGAIKRAAKKILVKQLKEMRERQGRLKKNKKRSNVNGNDGMLMREEEENTAKSSSNDGALAAGFILDNGEENAISTTTKQQHKSTTKYKTTEQEDEVISINSKDDSVMDQVAMIDQAVAIQSFKQQQKKNESDDENDWEMSMAVQESINDSLQQPIPNSSPSNDTNEEETTTYDTINAKTGHHQTITSNQYNPTYFNNNNSITNEQIASFNMHERHEWIESQKRQQRITSRKECITAAANPLDYSNTQLKNFLKSSRLSKRVGEIDKLVKVRESNGVEGGGFDIAAEEEAYSGVGGFATRNNSGGGIPTTRPLQRLKRQNETQSDNDDEDEELFTSSSTNHETSTTANGGKTQAATMQALFGEDDIEEEGGGFLLPSSSATEPAKPAASSKEMASFAKMDSRKNEVVLLDDYDNMTVQSDDSSVEVVNKDGKILENGKDNMYENHTAQASNTQRSTAAATQHPSKLLELSTAEEEWEQWGGEEAVDVSEAAVQSKSTAPSRVNTNVAMYASNDDSDSDEGQDNTFLTLGQTTKRVYTSDAKKPAAAAANESVPPTKELDTAETEDEDEVDWEDGDSEGSSDHAEDEPSKDDAADQTEAARVTSDINQMQTETTLNGDQEDNLRHKSSRSTNMDTYTKSNDKNDVIELPSDGDEEESEAPSLMKQAPNNEKEEPLVIDSSDDDDNEFGTYRSDDPQAAALLRAQDTASRLTSWAGRAFQRAINDHTTEQSHVDSPDRDNEQSVKEHIDLTANNDDEVIDVDDNDMMDTFTDGKLPTESQTTTETTTKNNDTTTEQQQQSNNQQVLFDTSLEGLTEAHNAILEEDRTMERDLSTMTDEMKEDILKLLQLCGIPWVESPSEAEAQCAALEELGLVDGVVTEDSDIFVFGAKKVYKNFFNENKYCEAYYAKDIQRDLGLGKHQLVALAMLLGGDYTDGVKGVGIVNGMEILQAFSVDDSAEGIKNGLQRLREWLDGFGEPASSSSQKEVVFHNKHKSARTRWIAPADFPSHGIIKAYLQPVVDKSEATFSWGKPDLTSLQQYCAETLGWDQAETDRVVQPVLKVIEDGSKQTRLESYFMRYEDKQLAGKVKSKRLQAVLQDIQGNDNEIAGTDKNDMEMEDVDTSNDNDDEESKPKKKRQKR